MTPDQILTHIQQINDRQQLNTIIAAANRQLAQLDNIPIRLVLHDQTWYVILQDNKTINLGTKQTPAMLRASLSQKPPDPLSYAISDTEAHRRITNGQHVGWIETNDTPPRRQYYSLPEYRAACDSYNAWYKLISHPTAMIYGFSAHAMRVINELETRGYTIQYP